MLFRTGGQCAPKDSVDGRRARFPDARRRLPGPDVPGTGVPRSPVQVETTIRVITSESLGMTVRVAGAQVPNYKRYDQSRSAA